MRHFNSQSINLFKHDSFKQSSHSILYPLLKVRHWHLFRRYEINWEFQRTDSHRNQLFGFTMGQLRFHPTITSQLLDIPMCQVLHRVNGMRSCFRCTYFPVLLYLPSQLPFICNARMCEEQLSPSASDVQLPIGIGSTIKGESECGKVKQNTPAYNGHAPVLASFMLCCFSLEPLFFILVTTAKLYVQGIIRSLKTDKVAPLSKRMKNKKK